MKYKTLFRLALKVIGVWIFAHALGDLPYVWNELFSSIKRPPFSGTPSLVIGYPWARTLSFGIEAALGFYLFFGGEWIANKAIPSNRTYCHECGYLLKDLKGSRCPECDTPFRPDSSPPSASA